VDELRLALALTWRLSGIYTMSMTACRAHIRDAKLILKRPKDYVYVGRHRKPALPRNVRPLIAMGVGGMVLLLNELGNLIGA
jgi:hypothetical protein